MFYVRAPIFENFIFPYIISETMILSPAPRSGSCSNSCCVNSEYSCNPDGCYCDSMCVDNGNCCDDYPDVCPTPGNGTAQPPAQSTTSSLIYTSN